MTHDQEFLLLSLSRSHVIVSRVTQSLPINARVEIWFSTVREYLSRNWGKTLFEVFDDGRLARPWRKISTTPRIKRDADGTRPHRATIKELVLFAERNHCSWLRISQVRKGPSTLSPRERRIEISL